MQDEINAALIGATATGVAGVMAALATVGAAYFGAKALMRQAAKQAASQIEQLQINERIRLKLQIYEQIGATISPASAALDDLMAEVSGHMFQLKSAAAAAEAGRLIITPVLRLPNAAKTQTAAHRAGMKLIELCDRWAIVDPGIQVFRSAFVNNLKTLYDIYYADYAVKLTETMASSAEPEFSPAAWRPPSPQVLAELGGLTDRVVAAITDIKLHLAGFVREMQMALLGDLFDHRLPPRVARSEATIITAPSAVERQA